MGFLAVAIAGCVLPLMSCSALQNECQDDEVVIVFPQGGYGIIFCGGCVIMCCMCAIQRYHGEMSFYECGGWCLFYPCSFVLMSLVLTAICNSYVGEIIGITVGALVGILCLCFCVLLGCGYWLGEEEEVAARLAEEVAQQSPHCMSLGSEATRFDGAPPNPAVAEEVAAQQSETEHEQLAATHHQPAASCVGLRTEASLAQGIPPNPFVPDEALLQSEA